jgi:hypothetical protein
MQFLSVTALIVTTAFIDLEIQTSTAEQQTTITEPFNEPGKLLFNQIRKKIR